MNERILVVDDTEAILDAVTDALAMEGFQMHGASDGIAALEAAETEPFDLVILDLMLPGLSGTEICRRLRAESPVPIIMLTARDAVADRVLGLEIGADDTSPSRSQRSSSLAASVRSCGDGSLTVSVTRQCGAWAG